MSNNVAVPMLRLLFTRYDEVKAYPDEPLTQEVELDELSSNKYFSVFVSLDSMSKDTKSKVAFVRQNVNHDYKTVKTGIWAYVEIPEVRDPVKVQELAFLRRSGINELTPIFNPTCGPTFKKSESLSCNHRFYVYRHIADPHVAKIWFPNSSGSDARRIVAEFNNLEAEKGETNKYFLTSLMTQIFQYSL
jgi:hypothetical protein